MRGAEIIAQKTHAAEVAFFWVNAVPFDIDKNAHGAKVNAPVGGQAIPRSTTLVRIDIHLSPYRCRGSDLHGHHLLSS
ncbi:MAG: hypothetical protein WB986_03095 [Methanoregula sp.]|uniref:hypothetical protein n=1 Tax=Methanoregula sp. TaxID=2052170 RepID=UPI003C53F930